MKLTPYEQRSFLRRHIRKLVPFIAVALLPAPVALGGLVLLGGGWAAAKLIGRAQRRRRLAEERADPARIQLGTDSRGQPITLHEEQLGAHGLIVGASGSGKSTTLLTILGQQILRGRPVVAIDLKGSPEFEAQLRETAEAAGRPFRVWTLDGAEHWNPLGHGNATELKDKLITAERFTEPHYQRAAERYVQTAIQVIQEVTPGQEPSLAQVVEMLDPRRLTYAARGLSPERRSHVQDYVSTLAPDQLSAVRGLQSRLAVLSESHTGPFLEPAPGAIDLRRALDGPEVVLFSLNSSTYGQLAAQLGTLAVQDLVSGAGARERAGQHVTATVAIDEFSGLGSGHVMSLVARGRSAGVSVLLATQELADLDRVSRGFRQQVVGSTAVKIAHRQDVSESALAVAQLAGTERVWEKSYSEPDGWLGISDAGGAGGRRVTSRQVDRPRIDPSAVQTFQNGEIALITKVPSSETHLLRVQKLGLGRPAREPGRER